MIQEVNLNRRRYFVKLASGMIISRNRKDIRKRICIESDTVMPPIRSLETITQKNSEASDITNSNSQNSNSIQANIQNSNR